MKLFNADNSSETHKSKNCWYEKPVCIWIVLCVFLILKQISYVVCLECVWLVSCCLNDLDGILIHKFFLLIMIMTNWVPYIYRKWYRILEVEGAVYWHGFLVGGSWTTGHHCWHTGFALSTTSQNFSSFHFFLPFHFSSFQWTWLHNMRGRECYSGVKFPKRFETRGNCLVFSCAFLVKKKIEILVLLAA